VVTAHFFIPILPMLSSLSILRQTPQIGPARFLAAHPGCWIQYYDDTGAKDAAKALSARSFNVAVARRKQLERCAVCFSLQAFGAARTKEGLLSYRNLGVDIDLIPAAERRTLTAWEIDRRKDEYLTRVLLPFPLKPHWLIETRHGFHAVFRVQPQRSEESVRAAAALNRRLVSLLQGDENAALLTQVLRVPNTYQFKDPRHPFLCRLLLDNAAMIVPYELQAVGSVLDAWEIFAGKQEKPATERTPSGDDRTKRTPRDCGDALKGVPEGQRNAAAASIIGRLPEYLWETAGWGGLKEWNQRNPAPLPERELRSVFESIARRERTKRRRPKREVANDGHTSIVVRVEVRIERGTAAENHGAVMQVAPPPTACASLSPSTPC
jgi:hypothetical protein